jgi:hypothetical protein
MKPGWKPGRFNYSLHITQMTKLQITFHGYLTYSIKIYGIKSIDFSVLTHSNLSRWHQSQNWSIVVNKRLQVSYNKHRHIYETILFVINTQENGENGFLEKIDVLKDEDINALVIELGLGSNLSRRKAITGIRTRVQETLQLQFQKKK